MPRPFMPDFDDPAFDTDAWYRQSPEEIRQSKEADAYQAWRNLSPVGMTDVERANWEANNDPVAVDADTAGVDAMAKTATASKYIWGPHPTNKLLPPVEPGAKLQSTMGQSPVGRYQFVRKTLRGLANELGLKGDELMDAELQDRLGRRLMTESGYDRKGVSSRDLQIGFSNHWASIATPNGRSVDPHQKVRMTGPQFFDAIARARSLDSGQ